MNLGGLRPATSEVHRPRPCRIPRCRQPSRRRYVRLTARSATGPAGVDVDGTLSHADPSGQGAVVSVTERRQAGHPRRLLWLAEGESVTLAQHLGTSCTLPIPNSTPRLRTHVAPKRKPAPPELTPQLSKCRPRASGGVPWATCASPRSAPSAPRKRGCSVLPLDYLTRWHVGPAQAGVFLADPHAPYAEAGRPRASGGVPCRPDSVPRLRRSAPRERGTPVQVRRMGSGSSEGVRQPHASPPAHRSECGRTGPETRGTRRSGARPEFWCAFVPRGSALRRSPN